MRGLVAGWNAHQVPLYLGAIVLGAAVGLLAPSAAVPLEPLVTPVLALLLFATFLAVPLVEVGRAFRDIRFLVTVLVANFVVVPPAVFGLSRFVADDRGLLVGVLLVLLAPCIDYVIVFTGLAGGARARLLAATPLLMVVQIAVLPAYLWLFAGADVVGEIDARPFVAAFVFLIAVPLAAAALVQTAARRLQVARTIASTLDAAMVPLMMATLAVVVGSQIAAVGDSLPQLWRLVPLYVAFVVAATFIGRVVGAVARLDVPATRALTFSVATRNSLVVLPIALALPPSLGIAPLAVVTQTLVELVAMVVLVRVVPRMTPAKGVEPQSH